MAQKVGVTVVNMCVVMGNNGCVQITEVWISEVLLYFAVAMWMCM